MSVVDAATPETVADRADITADWLVARIPGRSANEIGARLEALIRSGELPFGSQLPTIRELARVLSVSVGTVLIAWNHLRERDLIETHRRGGTTVRLEPTRAIAAPAPGSWHEIDFLIAAPDISLQPDLSEALVASLSASDLNVFGRELMTQRLRAAVEPAWPFEAEAWATAGGGTEALLLATAAAAPPGSVVAVDEPVSPGFLDTLRDLQLTAVGVRSDAEGPTVESLREALAHDPRAFIFQPGAAFAVEHSVSARRAEELGRVLADHPGDIWVVEDDSIGPLATDEPPTLGLALPHRVIRVRSYCKAFGIDVRTSVLGGSRELIERSSRLRSHGVGSNSRILQNTLAHLIGSDTANSSVDSAREIYRGRKAALAAALRDHGLTVHSGERSVVLWVEVADETATVLRLASKGISVGTGSKSFVSDLPTGLIRVSPLQLPDDPFRVDQLATIIADAASGSLREYFD